MSIVIHYRVRRAVRTVLRLGEIALTLALFLGLIWLTVAFPW